MRLCVRLSFCDAESIDKVDGWIDGWMGDMDWWICVNCGIVHACVLASSQLPLPLLLLQSTICNYKLGHRQYTRCYY